jgi:hypothetical protein
VRLGRVAQQRIDLGGTEIARVDGDDAAALGVVALLRRALPSQRTGMPSCERRR